MSPARAARVTDRLWDIGQIVKGSAMSTPFVFAALVSAALLCSHSARAADIRPEVARPLDDARVLANGWSDKALVLAKLNQAASVPNLSKDEQEKIRATTIYALARVGYRGIPGAESSLQTGDTSSARSSINATFPYR
jgi:hypothetical protein